MRLRVTWPPAPRPQAGDDDTPAALLLAAVVAGAQRDAERGDPQARA